MEKQIVSSFVSSLDESFVHEDIFCEEGEGDLSYWEFINSSETQSDDDVISFDDGFTSWGSSISSSLFQKIDDPVEDHVDLIDGHCDFSCQEEDFDGDQAGVKMELGDFRYSEEEENVEVDAYDDYDGDGDGDGDGYGLDDELVPWAVSGKFGRQRMRKLGKRSFAKMNHSKKSPCAYVKPGCVRGKHGLGLKHSC